MNLEIFHTKRKTHFEKKDSLETGAPVFDREVE